MSQLVISRPFVETSALLMENVTLPFQTAGIDGCANFTLKRDDVTLLTATFKGEKTFRAGRVVIFCSGNVFIENTACSDSGTYSLIASYNGMTATAFIIVNICQATDIVSRSRVTARNGLRATLNLRSAGKILFFKKNDNFLWPSNRITIQDRSIMISPVYRFDSGIYTICFANAESNRFSPNECNRTCEEIELYVQEFPKIYIYTPRHFISAKRHRHCSVKCHTSGFPAPLITWMKNGRVFDPQSNAKFHWEERKGELFVPCWDIDDSARYTCMANNEVGTDSKSVTITVMKEVGEFAEEGEDIVPTKPTLYQVLRRDPIYHRIQSQHSSYYVLLNVHNEHWNPVDIIWINYQGDAITIKTVQPNAIYKMFSYRTHPLVAMDTVTKQWLTINGRFPFYPNPVWREDVTICNPYANINSSSRYTGTKLRSLGLVNRVYIRFFNQYSRPIDLMWVHMNGSMIILQKTIESNSKVSYMTYEGDLWMARDSRTGRNLLINDSLVFPAPKHNVSEINITETESCGSVPVPQDRFRDEFFVFGCRGIHVVDAYDAQVTNFISYNTTVLVNHSNRPICARTTLADPSTHDYENVSSTPEWVGKTRSSESKILEELLSTGSWSSARYPPRCPRCDICRWGQPVRACGKFIYVPEAATRRIYVIDVAKEEIVDAIQLISIPYRVQFVAAREEIWIQAYDTPTLAVIRDACRDDAKVVVAAEERPNKIMGYNVMTFGNGIRGRTDTALVTSPHDSKIGEFNLEELKFGSLALDTAPYGCLNTFGMTYSPLNGHAFVSCFRQSGMCSLLEINTLTMRVVEETPMRGCGYSYVSPDGHYVVTIPQMNPNIHTDPDVLVQEVSTANGSPATYHCSVPVNDTIGYFFASRPGFLASSSSSWNVFFTFKALNKVLKVSLGDSCRGVRVLERFGNMMCDAAAGKESFSVGGLYARFIDVENAFAGRYLGTPAQHDNQFVIWDGQEEKVKWVQGEEMELPYYVVATGPPY